MQRQAISSSRRLRADNDDLGMYEYLFDDKLRTVAPS